MPFLSRFTVDEQTKQATFGALLVLAAIPFLIFSQFLPFWLPPLAVSYLVIVLVVCMFRGPRWASQTPFAALTLFFVFVWVAGLWVSPDLPVTLHRTYAFIANLALFWAVAGQRRSLWLSQGSWVLLLAGVSLSLFMLPGTRFVTDKLPFFDFALYDLIPGGMRLFWNAQGFHINLTGGLLALFLPPAVILALRGEDRGQRLVAAGASLLIGGTILLTQSRGALLGIAIAIPIVTSILDRRWLRFWGVAALIGLGAFILWPPARQIVTIWQEGSLSGDSSLLARTELWSRALQMSRDFPLTGVGMGMFERVLIIFYPLIEVYARNAVVHPHNILLQHSAEMGLPGLVAHLALYGTLAFLLLRRLRRPPFDAQYTLTLGLLGALIVYLVHGQFEVITYAPRAAVIVWSLFGLMSATALQMPGGKRTASA